MRLPPSSLFVGLTVSFALGCASARPPVDTVDDSVDELSTDSEPSDSEPTETAPTTTPIRSAICTPGALRACKYVMVDESGYKRCPEGRQECRPDGTGWLPCTMLAAGETPSSQLPNR